MITNKKSFFIGITMLLSFAIILGIIFTPVFNGKNGLCFLDNLFNSISKGSAYYVPAVEKEISAFKGKNIDLAIKFDNQAILEKASSLLQNTGIFVNTRATDLIIKGDLTLLLKECLKDSDLIYKNDGNPVKIKYNYNEKEVIYNWHMLLKKIDKELTRQENFKHAKAVALVNHKVVETAYNYYGITAKTVQESIGVLILSLGFYILYTLWYGFGLMYVFTGIGLSFDH